MAYKGDFRFSDEDDFMCTDGEMACCRCCCRPYIPGYIDSEGDGDVPGGVHEFLMPPERECDCSDRQLRLALEARGQDIALDRHGYALWDRLLLADGLGHLDVWDICRLSEAVGKTFHQLCDDVLPQLVLWHVQAWAQHMREKWREK